MLKIKEVFDNLDHFAGKLSRISASAILVGLIVCGGVAPRMARAATCNTVAQCQSQINSLNSQNSADKQSLGGLQSDAASYQSTVSQLESQIGSLQSQISTNQSQQTTLQTQIDADEQQVADKKAVLADDLKTMYVDGQMTTIEELATSKDLSDYVDKEQYRQVVQNQLDAIIQQIASLQAQQQQQKAQVDQLVSTEQTQNAQLNSSRAQQQALLGMNQAQQSAYNQQIASNNSSVSQLNARLIALNTVSGQSISISGTCGGGYPASATNQHGAHWGCNYAQDGSVDNWNMYNRECVSYTAYMAATKYGVSTTNWGDAYEWVSAAEAHGYTVNQTPSAGAIAIRGRDYSEAGDVGHAMYVVAVNGSNSITVDEYNEHYNGTFDERTFSPSSYASRGGMYYIHFR